MVVDSAYICTHEELNSEEETDNEKEAFQKGQIRRFARQHAGWRADYHLHAAVCGHDGATRRFI